MSSRIFGTLGVVIVALLAGGAPRGALAGARLPAIPPVETPKGSPGAPGGTVEPSPAAPAAQEPHLQVSVRTDKALYKNGERVKIQGRVVNITGEPRPSVVDVRVAQKDEKGSPNWQEPVFQTVIELTGTEFTDESYTIQIPESDNPLYPRWFEFAVGAQATPRGKGASTTAFTYFAVQEIGYLWMAIMIGIPALFVIASVSGTLFGCMSRPVKTRARGILWLLYCSAVLYLGFALVWPVLISFSPGTEAFFRSAPVGIVRVATEKIKDVQWALNIGGTISGDVVRGGYVVPLFVMILGMVGGVINMFLKLPEFLRDYHAIPDGGPEEAHGVALVRANAFRYFVYIITGPFLAMITYSLLALADFTNALVLSVVAFSVGFRADSIVEWMLEFSDSARLKARQAGSGLGAPSAAASAAAATATPAMGPAVEGGRVPEASTSESAAAEAPDPTAQDPTAPIEDPATGPAGANGPRPASGAPSDDGGPRPATPRSGAGIAG